MRTIGKIFGVVLFAFGFVIALFDALEWVEITKNFPNIPNVNEYVQSSVGILILSILLVFAGAIIYRKS
jgi:hypothetical protein